MKTLTLPACDHAVLSLLRHGLTEPHADHGLRARTIPPLALDMLREPKAPGFRKRAADHLRTLGYIALHPASETELHLVDAAGCQLDLMLAGAAKKYGALLSLDLSDSDHAAFRLLLHVMKKPVEEFGARSEHLRDIALDMLRAPAMPADMTFWQRAYDYTYALKRMSSSPSCPRELDVILETRLHLRRVVQAQVVGLASIGKSWLETVPGNDLLKVTVMADGPE